MTSRPSARSVSASANAAGTVGDTACVGGLDIGSKSSTCIEIALRYAAFCAVVLKSKPHTAASSLQPMARTCSTAIAGAVSCVPASATAMPSAMSRLVIATVGSSSVSNETSQIRAANVAVGPVLPVFPVSFT